MWFQIVVSLKFYRPLYRCPSQLASKKLMGANINVNIFVNIRPILNIVVSLDCYWTYLLEYLYSSTCHGRSLGWTATCFGRPLLRCTNYFAMLKYLHPTATCLTRPADSKMLDCIPAKAVNCHGSFQICGNYCDIFWSTHYTVDKCCWFFHTFSALSVSSLTVGL